MSACGQFTDKNSHARLEVACRHLDVAVDTDLFTTIDLHNNEGLAHDYLYTEHHDANCKEIEVVIFLLQISSLVPFFSVTFAVALCKLQKANVCYLFTHFSLAAFG